MEDSLRQAERKGSEDVRVAALAYWEDGFAANRIRWSEEGCQILGLPAGDRSRTWEQFLTLVHPEDRGIVDGARTRAKGGQSGYWLAFRVVRPGGGVRYLVVINDVVRDVSGRPVRSVGAAQDVTELREAERAEALYRALLDRTSDMVEVVDPDTGRFLDVNEPACLAHGFSRDEYLARRVADLDPTLGEPSNFARTIAHLRQAGAAPPG